MILRRLLREARDLGFLGPGPVEAHLDHALALAEAVEACWTSGAPGTVVDLGSGGGAPGLMLATCWETSRFLFVEARARRAAFLARAVDELGLGGRVVVEAARAEVVGRVPEWRCAFDVTTARGFGRPAVTAECAAPFLVVGGLLVVSEPPPGVCDIVARWPEAGLTELGMGRARAVDSTYQFAVVPQVQPCPSQFPRRVGVPSKRPLF